MQLLVHSTTLRVPLISIIFCEGFPINRALLCHKYKLIFRVVFYVTVHVDDPLRSKHVATLHDDSSTSCVESSLSFIVNITQREG